MIRRGPLTNLRWHGKKNLILTLRQLQRTATFVFPEEVAKNGEESPMHGTGCSVARGAFEKMAVKTID